MAELFISRLTAWFSASVDLGYLIDPAEADSFIDARTSRHWLDEVTDTLGEHVGTVFADPTRVVSEYARTDRAQRNTFASQHAQDLLPVEFALREPDGWQQGPFLITPEACRVSPRGAVTTKLRVDLNSGEWFAASDIVDDYNLVLRLVPRIAHSTFSKFFACWNRADIDPRVITYDELTIARLLVVYDVIDARFGYQNNNDIVPISDFKEVYRSDPELVRYLAAVCAMSMSAIRTRRHKSVDDYVKSDIGNRSDELWVVNKLRMVRDHPDRAEAYVSAFFEDCRTLADILTANHATHNYLREWTSDARSKLMGLLTDETTDVRAAMDLLRHVACAGDLLVEPLLLHRDVRHAFFVQLADELGRVFEIAEERAASSAELEQYARSVEAVASARLDLQMTSLQAAQVQLGRTATRLTKVAVLFAIFGTALAASQIALLIVGTGQTKTVIVPTTTSPRTPPPPPSTTPKPSKGR